MRISLPYLFEVVYFPTAPYLFEVVYFPTAPFLRLKTDVLDNSIKNTSTFHTVGSYTDQKKGEGARVLL